jgi:ankyrin repeat protein
MTNGAHAECVYCSEGTSRVSLADGAQSIRPCLFLKVSFTSKVVKIIYIHTVDVNLKNKFGRTAPMLAVLFGEYDIF